MEKTDTNDEPIPLSSTICILAELHRCPETIYDTPVNHNVEVEDCSFILSRSHTIPA